MSLRLSKNEKLIFAMMTLILIGFVTLMQILFIQPLNSEIQNKQKSLKTENQLLNVIQQKKAGIKNNTFESTTKLQQKLPVKPLVEQMILDLEKAEVVSDSSIKSMVFTKDGESSGQEENSQSPSIGLSKTEQNSASTQASVTSVAEAQTTLPAGVKKVSVELKVESPSYEDLEKFISTLESQKRISVVEKIDFTGGKEITGLGQEEEPLIYTITISAFYMPDLKDLQNQLPKLETPAPANKRNPLSNFADISPSDNEETQNN